MSKTSFISYIPHKSFFTGLMVTIFLIGISFIFSLQLALYGDDWLRLHILKYNFDRGIGYSYFSLSSYFGPYNPQYLFLFFVRFFWGYNPFGYFLVSLILRMVGSIAFYFPLKKLTRSSCIGWIGAILLGTTPIGIQVTDWVFYMNTYASLIFLSGTFYFLLAMEDRPSFRNQLLVLLFSLIFIFIIPVRSYGFFFILLVYSIIKILFQQGTKKHFAIGQVIGIVSVYMVAKLVGSLGPTTDVLTSMVTGVSESRTLLSQHNYSFILVPLSDLGRIFFPDIFYQKLQRISSHIFQPNVLEALIIFGIIPIVSKYWKKVSSARLLVWILLNIGFILLVRVLFASLSGEDGLFAILAYIILFNTIYYLLYTRKFMYIGMLLLILGCFSLPYYLLPWSFAPSIPLTSDHRYLYFPAVGVIIVFIIIASVFFRNKKYKGVVIFLCISVITINFFSDTLYLRNQLRFRSEKRQEKIFTSLHKIIPYLPQNKQSVFYITDTTGKKTDVYTFGFPFYMGLSYGISDQGILPFLLLNIDEVKSATTDGRALKQYTLKLSKVSLDDIYFLKLLPNDTFVANKSEIIPQVLSNEK